MQIGRLAIAAVIVAICATGAGPANALRWATAREQRAARRKQPQTHSPARDPRRLRIWMTLANKRQGPQNDGLSRSITLSLTGERARTPAHLHFEGDGKLLFLDGLGFTATSPVLGGGGQLSHGTGEDLHLLNWNDVDPNVITATNSAFTGGFRHTLTLDQLRLTEQVSARITTAVEYELHPRPYLLVQFLHPRALPGRGPREVIRSAISSLDQSGVLRQGEGQRLRELVRDGRADQYGQNLAWRDPRSDKTFVIWMPRELYIAVPLAVGDKPRTASGLYLDVSTHADFEP